MSAINVVHRKRPFSTIIASDFFNRDDFFENPLFLNTLEEPALNIKETDDDYQLELSAPGYSKKDFEVNIDSGYLNISAKKSSAKEEKEDNYTCKEFSYNSFEKSFLLPDTIEDDKVKASYKNGILKFSLSKKEEAKKIAPKMVEIS